MSDWDAGAEITVMDKERILKRVSAFLELKPNLEAALEELNAGPDANIVEILVNHGLISESEKAHLEQDWFSGGGWWDADVAPIIAKGFSEAISTALNPPSGGDFLPIDCYWVRQNSNGAPVSVVHTWNSRQVTVVLFTPLAGVSSASSLQNPILVDQPVKVTFFDGANVVTRQLQHRE